MTTDISQPWHAQLTDSVFALGAAAREHQRAWRGAQLAVEQMDEQRLRTATGRVTIHGHTGQQPVLVHDKAIYSIADELYGSAERLRRSYQAAAIAYAHGTLEVIRRVTAGQAPERVELSRDLDGGYMLHWSEPLTVNGWHGAIQLHQAYRAVRYCEQAGQAVNDLASRPYLSDSESGEMERARAVVQGLADSALECGRLAEHGLHYALANPQLQRPQPQQTGAEPADAVATVPGPRDEQP